VLFFDQPDLKALSGNSVMRRTFSFSTGGPAIINSRPDEGNDRIDEEQIFMLTLDARHQKRAYSLMPIVH